MHEYELLEIFAAGFFLALVFGYAAHRLGFSPIVGYLLAGFVSGPYIGFFSVDMDLAFQLSEAGVILLMFGVGLHFDVKDLLAVKDVAIPGALAQSTAATIVGAFVAWGLGMSFGQGLMLGMALSVASTVVLLRVLNDNGVLNTIHGHVAVGWLVVEDLITVFMLVLLPSIATIVGGTGAPGAATIAGAVGLATLRLVMLWVLVMFVGGKVVPWLLVRIVGTRSAELFTLAILVSAFATATLSAVFFQTSMALGAFLGGMVIGRTQVSYQAGADVLPLRDAFSVLFFISIGMMFRPEFLVEQPLLIAAALGVVLLVKPLAAVTVVAVLGYSPLTALTVAVSLAQIGEFSFILAQGAMALGLIPVDIYNVLVVCAVVSIAINPIIFRLVPGAQRFVDRHAALHRLLNARAERKARKNSPAQSMKLSMAVPGLNGFSPPDLNSILTAVVVGFGPTGRHVVEILLRQRIIPCVIEMNLDTVNYLNREKICPAVFGNAVKRDVLLAARLDKANYLIITVPDSRQVMAIAYAARQISPGVRILARGRFLDENRLFEQSGINAVAYEEEGVARLLSEMLERDIEHCRNDATNCSIDFASLETEDFYALKESIFTIFN